MAQSFDIQRLTPAVWQESVQTLSDEVMRPVAKLVLEGRRLLRITGPYCGFAGVFQGLSITDALKDKAEHARFIGVELDNRLVRQGNQLIKDFEEEGIVEPGALRIRKGRAQDSKMLMHPGQKRPDIVEARNLPGLFNPETGTTHGIHTIVEVLPPSGLAIFTGASDVEVEAIKEIMNPFVRNGVVEKVVDQPLEGLYHQIGLVEAGLLGYRKVKEI